MIAKCIKADNEVDLTVGKEYKVIEFDNFHGWVRLIGDEGEIYWYAPVYVEVWE